MRDFLNIMRTHKYFNEADWNQTDRVYRFKGGGYIEFFGADEPAKLRGARRDILFINECNNIPYQAYEQLEVRTTETVFLDYNPVSEFWVHTEVIPKTDHNFAKLTYKDNEALEPTIIASIESRKDNPNWWKIYGLGEVGIKEGQVYDGWQQLDQIPDEAKLERYGLDFGYTNHPTALVAVYRWNDAYILDEVLYRTGMQNPDIARIIQSQPKALVVADSAEPKSIDEIEGIIGRGWITGASKGQGSVNQGIDSVQSQTVYVTKRSTNIIKESRNYLWKLDKDGNPMNVPEPVFDHAMDAARYAISDLVNAPAPFNPASDVFFG